MDLPANPRHKILVLEEVWRSHGCFSYYLQRFGKLQSSACLVLWRFSRPNTHLFECDAWHGRRFRLNSVLRSIISLRNFVLLMLRSREDWTLINQFTNEILIKKRVEGEASPNFLHSLVAAIFEYLLVKISKLLAEVRNPVLLLIRYNCYMYIFVVILLCFSK